MTAISAECARFIEEFYWPDLLAEADQLRQQKTRALMAAQHWAARGEKWIATSAFSLAGSLELELVSSSPEESTAEPSQTRRRESAVCCFSAAGDWQRVDTESEFLEALTPETTAATKRCRDGAASLRGRLDDLAVAWRVQDWDALGTVAEELIGHVPPSLVLWPMARAAQALSDERSARQYFQLLVIAAPKHYAYHVSADIGVVNIQHITYAARFFSKSIHAQATAAVALLEAGDLDAARAYADHGWKLTATQEVNAQRSSIAHAGLTLARIAVAQAQPALAVHVLRTCSTLTATSAPLTFLACMQIELVKHDSALDILQAALALNSEDAWARLLAATLLVEQKQFESAEGLFAWFSEQPELPDRTFAEGVLLNRGVALAMLNRSDAAANLFRRAAQLGSWRAEANLVTVSDYPEDLIAVAASEVAAAASRTISTSAGGAARREVLTAA